MSTAALPDKDQPSPSLALRNNALCDRFEAEWQSGKRPRLEPPLTSRIRPAGPCFPAARSLTRQNRGLVFVAILGELVAGLAAAEQGRAVVGHQSGPGAKGG
jgi:hypothetical protein